MKTLEYTAGAEDTGRRIDAALAAAFPELTRSFAQQLLAEGRVLCNGRSVAKSARLTQGDALCVSLPDAQPVEIIPQDIPLDIVYEDSSLLVVNKPKGMVVHPAAGNPDGTLVNALLYHCAGRLSGINGEVRPGIVHRIDKDTTGLLVVAKNDRAHLSLSAQIAEKTCAREYLALCEGIFKDDEGTISTYIGRHPTDRVKMAVVSEYKGRRAVTHYEVRTRFDRGFTLVLFKLETGRTHQIRVHAQYIGHPVVGDPVYGVKKQKFNLAGQLLHAARLSLDHPATGERMTFEAPLPEAFEKVLETLKKGGYTERKPC